MLTRQPTKVDKLTQFKEAVRLFYSIEQLANYNYDQLVKLQEPVAKITAKHSSVAAKKINPDDFLGLQPLVFLAKGATIMLTMNLWPAVGLYNSATGTVVDFLYHNNQQPPELPIAVVVKFDIYRGPSISNTLPFCVPICPVTVSAHSADGIHKRQQIADSSYTCMGNNNSQKSRTYIA